MDLWAFNISKNIGIIRLNLFEEYNGEITMEVTRLFIESILAEKGRFSRWGPYINHIGLIIFLFGILLRGLPGFYVDETLWLREGETRSLPGAPGYYLKNNEFIIKTYSKEEDEMFSEAIDRVGTIVKDYESDFTLYKEAEGELPGQSEELEFIKNYSVIVNKPLSFDGFNIYQMDYRLDELNTIAYRIKM